MKKKKLGKDRLPARFLFSDIVIEVENYHRKGFILSNSLLVDYHLHHHLLFYSKYVPASIVLIETAEGWSNR